MMANKSQRVLSNLPPVKKKQQVDFIKRNKSLAGVQTHQRNLNSDISQEGKSTISVTRAMMATESRLSHSRRMSIKQAKSFEDGCESEQEAVSRKESRLQMIMPVNE